MFKRLIESLTNRPSLPPLRMLEMDASKGLSCAKTPGGMLRLAFYDNENGARIVLLVPERHIIDLSRVVSQHAAFMQISQRRENERAEKVSGTDYKPPSGTLLQPQSLAGMWEEWEQWCYVNEFQGETPDTIPEALLTEFQFAYVCAWRARRRALTAAAVVVPSP